jgi:hypothetical protein
MVAEMSLLPLLTEMAQAMVAQTNPGHHQQMNIQLKERKVTTF